MIPRWNEIVELLKKGMTLAAQQKLLEVQEAYLARKEENLDLKREASELRAKLTGHSDMAWREPFYWRKTDSGHYDGPYGQLCFDRDAKKFRLARSEVQEVAGTSSYTCGCCDKVWLGKARPTIPL